MLKTVKLLSQQLKYYLYVYTLNILHFKHSTFIIYHNSAKNTHYHYAFEWNKLFFENVVILGIYFIERTKGFWKRILKVIKTHWTNSSDLKLYLNMALCRFQHFSFKKEECKVAISRQPFLCFENQPKVFCKMGSIYTVPRLQNGKSQSSTKM